MADEPTGTLLDHLTAAQAHLREATNGRAGSLSTRECAVLAQMNVEAAIALLGGPAGDVAPCCECGNCHGPDVLLPMDAWEVAGSSGAGKAADGTDLLACAPGHLPDGAVVLDDRGDWVVCGVPG